MSKEDRIHPEIEKFYTHSGYYVDTDVFLLPVGSPWRLAWFLMKGDVQVRLIGQSDLMLGWGESNQQRPNPIKCTIYLWEGKEYTEEEMLRLIRQKAFI